MDAVTVTFLMIGCFALVLLGVSLVGGGHFHLHVGHLHVGHVGHAPADGAGLRVTLPAIAGFLGTFGFVGAIAAILSGTTGTSAAVVATLFGVAAGLPAAWLANRMMDAAMRGSMRSFHGAVHCQPSGPSSKLLLTPACATRMNFTSSGLKSA